MRIKKLVGDHGYFKLKEDGGIEIYRRPAGWTLESVTARICRFSKTINIKLVDKTEVKLELEYKKRFPWRGAWYAQN